MNSQFEKDSLKTVFVGIAKFNDLRKNGEPNFRQSRGHLPRRRRRQVADNVAQPLGGQDRLGRQQ